MGRTDATTHGGGCARCGDIVASWFSQKTFCYKKSCVPWPGGAYPRLAPGPSRCTARGCGPEDALAGAQPSSPCTTAGGGRARARAGQQHAPPCCPGTARAYGRLGTAAFPVTFNWECSCQAERIRAGERNCPSVKVGQQYIRVLLRLRLCFPGGH